MTRSPNRLPIVRKHAVPALRAICALGLLTTLRLASAAPFHDLHARFTQPDGTQVEVVGWGDEFDAVFETPDGYTVVFDSARRAYCYARKSADGRLISSRVEIHRGNPAALGLAKHERLQANWRRQQIAARRLRWEQAVENSKRWQQHKAAARAAADPGAAGGAVPQTPPSGPTTGSKLGLCLLVDFDDDPATVPQAEIVNFCNGDNYAGYGNNGSVKQYFQEVSNGLLIYSNLVTIYIRIPNSLHPKSYYNDITRDCGAQANLLIRDAISNLKALPNYATEILPTFVGLTVDGNNRVLACNVFYAGGNGGVWSSGLWPHSWALYNVGAQELSAGGKKVYFYQICNIGSSLEIGTFCHENGHMLCGYPDLYDYTASSSGAGNWCLMAYGCYGGSPAGSNPSQVCAYLKRASGWAATSALTGTSSLIASVTAAAGANFNHFYCWQKPSVPTEYYLVEARCQANRDAALPGWGILVWHIDELGDNSKVNLNPNTTHTNYETTVVQADNLWHLEQKQNIGDANDLYCSGNAASGYENRLSDLSAPNAHWWDGTTSGLCFSGFSGRSADMTFAVGGAPVITSQPVSQAVPLGQDATFSVTAGGAPPAYQWRFNGENLAGATASGYSRTNAQLADAGIYTVVITNALGAITSSVATLSVLDPFIVASPQSQTGSLASTISFSVSAIGRPPLSCQWQRQGTNLAGATETILTLTNLQATDMGYYQVVVSNPFGAVTSQVATLVLEGLPPVVLLQPANQTLPASSLAVFKASAVGIEPLAYQWRRQGASLSDSSKITGTTGSTLTLSNAQAGDMGAYSLLVTNAHGQTASSNAALAVWPVAAWGQNGYGQSDVPAGLANVTAAAGGGYHSLALRADGTVAAWGAGPTNCGAAPHFGQSLVPASLSNVAAVAAGFYHSLALRADGTVVAWGAGTTNSGVSPDLGQSLVPAGLSNVVGLAAGYYHSLALKADGTVAAWGYNAYGQTNVPSDLTNAVALAAGGYHCLALRADGTVVAWGAGTTNKGVSPHYGQSAVPPGLSNVVAVAAGAYHSLALEAGGTVVAWGAGTNYGLPPRYGQAMVPAGLTNAVAISAGSYHSLALKSDGTLVIWGSGAYGQNIVPPCLAEVVTAAAGNWHNLVIEGDGRPRVTVHPFSQVANAGATVLLTALAVGAPPLCWQWQRNGTNVPCATNTSLTLSNIQALSAGAYSAVVTNSAGTAVSSCALLTVVSPPPVTLSTPVLLPDGTFQFALRGEPGRNYIVEASTNLRDWVAVQTNSYPALFSAPPTNRLPLRFYRGRVQQ